MKPSARTANHKLVRSRPAPKMVNELNERRGGVGSKGEDEEGDSTDEMMVARFM